MSAGPVSPRSLALPLRIGTNGQFERADQVRSIMALFSAMAATGPGGWPHAPWFALERLFARANPHVEEHPVIADALNLALTKLGVIDSRVGSVRTAHGADAPGARTFDITLVLEGGQIAHEHLEA